MYGVQCATKDLVEYITQSSTAAQLCRLDITRRTLNRGAVRTGELRDDVQQRLALVRNILAVGVE